jgi:hypothetical protein
MAKYQYIVCSNGRIALYEKKDFENAVSLEKSLLIICNGIAYVVGADRIDDNNYSCYTIKVNNITYTAEELQKFYKVIITEGIKVYMKTGSCATHFDTYSNRFADFQTSYNEFIDSAYYNNESIEESVKYAYIVDVEETKRRIADDIWDAIKDMPCFEGDK